MDLGTAILPIVSHVVAPILRDIYKRWRDRPKVRGVMLNQNGAQYEMSNVSGVLSLDEMVFLQPDYEMPPILLTGRFIADQDFADLAEIVFDQRDEIVLIVALDHQTQDVYFCQLDFEGYALSLWPGSYSLYAFVVDPILDETIAVGYPAVDGEDPNPLALDGEGAVELDFLLIDVDD